MDVSQTTLIGAVIAQILTFLGVLVAGVLSYIREGRTRRWQLEDRAFIVSQQVIATAKQTADLTVVTRKQTAAITEHTSAVVGEATDAAHAAYKEANDVNLKIAQLGLDHVRTEAALSRAVEVGVQAELARLDAAGKGSS